MSTTEQSSDFDGSMYYVLLILLLCTLLMGPCVFFPRQRIICFRRIRQRRWNVATDDIVRRSVLGGNFRPRYPRDDPRHVVTKEEAEKSKREFLLKRLKDYTKTIEETDLVLRNAAEFGKVVSKDEENRHSLCQNLRSSLPVDIIATIMSVLDGNNDDSIKNGDATDVDLATSDKKNNQDIPDESRSDRSQDRKYHVDVEAGLGIETEKGHTEIANTCAKNEDKHDETTIRLLQLPFPGRKAPVDADSDSPAAVETDDLRVIFPECAVCLNEFKVGERISWSPENDCDHVFHQDCIIQWFLALSSRDDAKRRKKSYDVECKLHCPMCRQDFIASSTTFSDSEIEDGGE